MFECTLTSHKFPRSCFKFNILVGLVGYQYPSYRVYTKPDPLIVLMYSINKDS